MSKTERTYALLVEANPVPDPEALPERLAEPRLVVVDPGRESMQETTEKQQETRTRNWIPAFAVAAFVIAAVAIGALILTNGADVASRENAAVAVAEAELTAINNGDLDAITAGFDDTPDEANRQMWEANIASAAVYPFRIEGCEATFTGDEYINVDCSIVITEPVYVAMGVSELTVPYFVYDDGTVEARRWQGANFSLANGAYRDYLRLHHPNEYEAVCSPLSYPAGSIAHDAGMAITPECVALYLPLADDVAAWVEAGKPGS